LSAYFGEQYSQKDWIGMNYEFTMLDDRVEFRLKKRPFYGGHWVLGKMCGLDGSSIINIRLHPPVWLTSAIVNMWIAVVFVISCLEGRLLCAAILVIGNGGMLLISHMEIESFREVVAEALSIVEKEHKAGE